MGPASSFCWEEDFSEICFPLEISKILEVLMFADDTSILCTVKDYYNLKTKLDVVLNHMFLWFQNNQLMLNLNKTKMIK
jgi:hypothetical protein